MVGAINGYMKFNIISFSTCHIRLLLKGKVPDEIPFPFFSIETGRDVDRNHL